MYRTDKLVVRLTALERAAIDDMARRERLPASTLARRLLLQEVDRRGLWPAIEQAADRGVSDGDK